MIPMHHRSLFRLCVVIAGFGLAASSLATGAQQDTTRRGRKYKPPPPTARIEVTILRAFNCKPIENAAVVFHPMAGEKDKGNMELKTNEDGKTVIDVLPIGDTVRLQVIAKGFQTYGQDYKIDKDAMTIQIELKRPGEQYSIYEHHDQTAAPPAKTCNVDKAANSTSDAAPAPTKDKPAGSAEQPNAQPSPAQAQPQPK